MLKDTDDHVYKECMFARSHILYAQPHQDHQANPMNNAWFTVILQRRDSLPGSFEKAEHNIEWSIQQLAGLICISW